VATTATHSAPDDRQERLAVLAMAVTVLALVVGVAFAAGWLLGRILL
jgi:hypothetical protein